MLKKIDRVLSKICGAFGVISVLCLVGVIALITVDVVIRKFGGNVKGAYEITERLLMCTVFSGLAYTESKRGHICVTMLLGAFPRAVRFAVFGLMQLTSTAMSFYVAYAAYSQTLVSLKTKTCTTVLQIPLYPFYAVESVCMVLFGIALLWASVKSFAAIKNDEMAEEIQGSWS